MKMVRNMNKTYTVKEVAGALEFSANTIYKYLNEGKIKATRLGEEGRFRIPESEVVRLLGLREKKSPVTSEAETKTEFIGEAVDKERMYDKESLEKFLFPEYFLRGKEVQKKILEPLIAYNLLIEKFLKKMQQDLESTPALINQIKNTTISFKKGGEK